MTHAVTHDTRSRRNDVCKIGEALQEVLVDLVDLSLLGKHLHWNVEGLLPFAAPAARRARQIPGAP